MPQGFPQPAYNFASNPLTEEGFGLGKKLFFDGRYSVFRAMIQHDYKGVIVQSPTLDPLLVNGIAVSPAEEDAPVAFVRTLSDSAFLNNTRYRQ